MALMAEEMGRLEAEIAQVAARLDGQESPAEADIDQGLGLLDDVVDYLERVVSSFAQVKENIVVLGATGAGKSTVISFLFSDGDTVVRHESKYARVLVAEQPLPGVSIKSGRVSSTLLPVSNHVNLRGRTVAVWDMPGSRDTRGAFVELVVHCIYQWMLIDKKKLSFIVVSAPLHERTQIAALENTINGSLIRADNAVVVYTKCSSDFDPESTADLDLHDEKRGIRSFGLPEPKRADPDGHNYSLQYRGVKEDLLSALSELKQQNVTYSEPLPDAAHRLLSEFCERCVVFARETVSLSLVSAYYWSGYRGTLAEIEKTLEALKSAGVLSLEGAIDTVLRLIPCHADAVKKDGDITKACRRLGVAEGFLGAKIARRLADWLNVEGIAVVESAKERLTLLRDSILAAYWTKHNDGTNTLVICAFQLQLSQEMPRILAFAEKTQATSVGTIPNVILVGFASLNVDIKLKAWANIALVSPTVNVTVNWPMDLSGTGQPASFKYVHCPAGSNGRPGAPGLPGGNLVVVCNELTGHGTVIHATISRGQRGGDGQNGGNGRNGKNAMYLREDFKRAVDRALDRGILSRSPRSSVLNPHGLRVVDRKQESSPLFGGLFTLFFGVQTRRQVTLEKRSEAGAPCKPPGRAGCGGNGGAGGRIRIFRGGLKIWDTKGAVGDSGLDRRPGGPVHDGKPSDNFVATVQQWSLKGGLFSGFACPPTIDVQSTPGKEPATVCARATISRASFARENPFPSWQFVKSKYQAQRRRLEADFPRCDFSDLNLVWPRPQVPS